MSDLAALLDELALAPNMPAARCAGRHELYDAAIESASARTEALRLCAGCPELAPCAAWFDGLRQKHRPLGVVAGRLNIGRTRPERPTNPTPKGLTA